MAKKSKVVIFGDSYSTFDGWVPEGNAVYYAPGKRYSTDLEKVEQTWWHACARALDWDLVLNESWSGSTVCYTGWEGVDCSQTSSFIRRFRKLVAEDFFNKNAVDTVVVFGATNDSWSNAPLGEMKYSDWQEEDLYSVLPAVCYFAYSLKQHLPNARIVFLVNSPLKPEVMDGIVQAAAYYGVESLVLQDIDKQQGHPTIKGMATICEQTVAFFKNK